MKLKDKKELPAEKNKAPTPRTTHKQPSKLTTGTYYGKKWYPSLKKFKGDPYKPHS